MAEKRGLLIIHTGKGKGKTTAALGLALRAWGGSARVLILQFIKGGQNCGELAALEKIAALSGLGKISLKRCGLGFTKSDGENFPEHRAAAQEALNQAKDAFAADWDMIILDEINYAVDFGLISKEELLALIKLRPASLHLVLTGRNALPEVIELADLVTEMTEIKHPFAKGVKAQEWIEY